MRVLFRASLLLAFTATLWLPAPTAHAQEDENLPNEFIFQVLLPPSWFIAEAVFAYERNGKYYLPIAELSRDLDFFVDTETENLYAKGFAGNEQNSFTIDQQRNELVFQGQRESIPDDAVLVSDYLATDDLYVELEVLNKIWPIEMSLDLSRLTINIEAEEELPFMKKKEREDKRKKVAERQNRREERKKLLPRRENPYKWFGKPVVDIQTTHTYDGESDDITGNTTFSGLQQLGKMLAEFSATFKTKKHWEIDRPDSIRMKFSRKSAGKEYLAPGLRSYEFGDVNLRQRDLISNTESGRGVTVSNDNRDRFNEFDTITIEGTGPPGWDIELYNNEELIAFSTVPDDGEYFFEDVALNYGNNQIKLIFFGPQGQIREETRSYNAGGNMLPPGEMVYHAGVLDSNRDFILLANEPRTTPRGVTKTGDVSYGINRWLTVFGTYTELPETDKDHSYFTTGASTSTPVGLVEAEGYKEINGGAALSLNYVTSFLGVRTNLGVARYNNFESSDTGFGTNRKTFETTGLFNKQLKIFGLPLGLRLGYEHTARKTGDPQTTLTTAQTLTRSGLRLSHSTTSRYTDFVHQSTNAGITTTWREGPWQLRGGFNYSIYPLFELNSFNSDLRYRANDKLQTAVTFGHNFKTSDYNAGFQVGYDFEKFLSSIETRYERDHGWDIVLRATTSLNPYTPDGHYTLTSKQARQQSPINAHVFLDKNLDGVFNGDDEPLEGVKLNIGQGLSKNETDENGKVITSAPADKLTNFQIAKSSLVDPYYQPGSKGFSTVPNRGSIIEASFPVIETGAVEGTVYRTDNDKIVSGLTLDLYDENGEKQNSVVSAFDGYYTFEFVPPGNYTIKADPSHGVTLLDNAFTLPPQDLFVYGNDLYVDIPQSVAQGGNETFGPHMPGTEPQEHEPFGPFINDAQPAAGNAQDTEQYEDHDYDPLTASPPPPPEQQQEPEFLQNPLKFLKSEKATPNQQAATATAAANKAPATQKTVQYGPYWQEPLPSSDEPQALKAAPSEQAAIEPAAGDMPVETATTHFGKTVQTARLKEHGEQTRLVLEVTKNTGYTVLPAQDPTKIQVEIKQALWGSAPETQNITHNGNTYAYSVESTQNGTLLTISSDKPISLKRSLSLPADGNEDQRLLFDIN